MGLLHGVEMTASYILHSVFRLIQMIMALAVCGLYGVDLNKADKEHKYSDGKWVCLPSFPCLSPSPSLFESKMLMRHATGLRRSHRVVERLLRPALPHPLHVARPVRVGG
jgi:hypothetical protein